MRLELEIWHYPRSQGGRENPFICVLNLQSRHMNGASMVYVPHGVEIEAGGTQTVIVEPYSQTPFDKLMARDKLFVIGHDKTVIGEAIIRKITR